MTNYTAVCRRSGDWWAISVPELKGVHTQAKRLEQAEDMARDAIALLLGVAPDSFSVDVQPDVPAKVSAAIAARQAAAEAMAFANRSVAAAVEELGGRDRLVTRDIAFLLHLSPQRVSQISGAKKAKGKQAQNVA